MKKGLIIAAVLLMVAAIIGLIAIEYAGNRPGKRGENPYAYRIGTLADVDSSWLQWKEIRQIRLEQDTLSAIAALGERIFITGTGFLTEITGEGRQLRTITLDGTPTAMTVSGDTAYVAFTRYIALYSLDGQRLQEWEPVNGLSYITSLKVSGKQLFAADAGNREVLRYSTDGKLLLKIAGKNDAESLHGFIVPSPYFDLDINQSGELWIANTGMHALENYGTDGSFRGFWTNPSYDLEGFTGCCNPAHMVIMDDGTFVTSEKGLVRIKTYKPSGELLSVVAPPSAFGSSTIAPDLAVTPAGLIFALDFNINRIRIFMKKSN
ncbi:MAG: hypothetical protein ACOYXB_09675 [Bacteroidota bacterium]